MSVQVKICGLSTETTAQAAIEAGAAYIGLVFYPPSPRYVSLEDARAIRELARGRAQAVALTVDACDAELDAIVAAVDPDVIQLHGRETPERVAELRQRFGRPIIKAVHVLTRQDVEGARGFEDVVDLLLYDAMPRPGLDQLPGGNGVAFDWQALTGASDKGSFVLSGGLTPDNVGEAIRLTGATVVDVSSGVERAPGDKDTDLIARFIAAAHAADRQGDR